jgi:hypothetical protein
MQDGEKGFLRVLSTREIEFLMSAKGRGAPACRRSIGLANGSSHRKGPAPSAASSLSATETARLAAADDIVECPDDLIAADHGGIRIMSANASVFNRFRRST